MAQTGFSTVGGYGSPIINSDGSAKADPSGGSSALGPQFNGKGGVLATLLPIMTAVLVELRVQNRILQEQRGTKQEDIEQMRADELWNITPGEGTA